MKSSLFIPKDFVKHTYYVSVTPISGTEQKTFANLGLVTLGWSSTSCIQGRIQPLSPFYFYYEKSFKENCFLQRSLILVFAEEMCYIPMYFFNLRKQGDFFVVVLGGQGWGTCFCT